MICKGTDRAWFLDFDFWSVKSSPRPQYRVFNKTNFVIRIFTCRDIFITISCIFGLDLKSSEQLFTRNPPNWVKEGLIPDRDK
jgi:hypothetical protein